MIIKPKLTPSEWAWIAGFFEGEGFAGCYQMRKQRKHRKTKIKEFSLKVDIGQKDPSPLIWIKNKLNFGYITSHYGTGYSANLQYNWSTASMGARYFLNKVYPYLKSNYKKEQVEKALQLDKKYTRAGANKGEKHSQAKLNTLQVRQIKKWLEKGVSQVLLARRYGVGRSLINHIYKGRLWKEVKI